MKWHVVLTLFLAVSAAARAEERIVPNEPKVAAASDEAEKAISRFRVPAGLKVELVAAEPLVANPVAMSIDEHGKIYVAETFRQTFGAEDNREHAHWLDDDLAAQTVDDRLAYFKKHLKDKLNDYAKEQDRVRVLVDRDGDGKMDDSTVFAGPFSDVLEGIGSGVLARNDVVYYTCIPHLWLLRDTNGDGKADERKALHRGYGVRVAFRGHDLHGLCFGPDGKLYYSIGDRGFNVTNGGRTLAYPDRGAVLRCNPDGSELEVVATGLRNPEELAFDQFGNLFTGDNNSDSGDRARWVNVVEGGDTGWRMYYQYLGDRGPWNREKLWHTPWEGQAAYIVPPIAHLASGPAGLTYYPGVGLPEAYQNHFFLVDFRGGAAASGVHSFAVRPKGASFELVDQKEFFWSILATDCEFGPDGAFYVLDWVDSWNGVGKGRIYKAFDPEKKNDALVVETKKLIAEPRGARRLDELIKLLGHADMRVRQRAQYSLAAKQEAGIEPLASVAKQAGPTLPRLHAIWGLGQIGRRHAESLEPVVGLLYDADAEVRAQAAKVLGDGRVASAFDGLVARLQDENARVRMLAAISLGKLGRKEAVAPLLAMLRANDEQDPYLRHGAVMGLAGSADAATLAAVAADESAAARLGAVVALRRQSSPEVARFLNDTDQRVVEEAARVIYDLPLDSAMPQLAALITRSGLTEPTLWRVVNANFTLGQAENALAVARFSARAYVPDAVRTEAMNGLLGWTRPSSRDRVLGCWRPLDARAESIVVDAVRAALPAILTAPEKTRQLGVQLAGRLGIREVGPALYATAADKQRPAAARVEAIQALAALKDSRIFETMELALADGDAAVRAAGERLLGRYKPQEAVRLYAKVLAGDSVVEQQEVLAALGEMKEPQADAVLADWLDKLTAGQVRPEIQLDLLGAAAQRAASQVKDKLAAYDAARSKDDSLAAFRETLAGGSVDRGQKIFFERTEASCARCHKIAGTGGDVGPDLSKIGADKQREYLLESIVQPNKAIAKGFDSVVLTLDDGKVLSGVLRSEDDKQLKLVTPEGKQITVARSQIDERTSGKSPMPEDVAKKLSKADIRDLVEFLWNQKAR